jgi:hypothetical protein
LRDLSHGLGRTEALGAVAFAEGAPVADGVLDNDAIQLARDVACSEEAFS